MKGYKVLEEMRQGEAGGREVRVPLTKGETETISD